VVTDAAATAAAAAARQPPKAPVAITGALTAAVYELRAWPGNNPALGPPPCAINVRRKIYVCMYVLSSVVLS